MSLIFIAPLLYKNILTTKFFPNYSKEQDSLGEYVRVIFYTHCYLMIYVVEYK